MLLSSIDGLIDALQDPDSSGWEKFLAILSSVSMVAMSLISIIGAIGTALVAFKLFKDKESIATWLNTKLTRQNTKAKQENAVASDLQEKETREETREINKNTYSKIANNKA
jgi:hypothetical protein